MPELTPQQKAQLDSNIRAMLNKGASQEDVMTYSKDFRTKYDVPIVEPQVKKKDWVSSVFGGGSKTGGTPTTSTLGSEDEKIAKLMSGIKGRPATPQDEERIKKNTTVDIDVNDPVKSFLAPLNQRKKEIFDRSIGSESTAQNKVLKKQLSDEVNNINQTDFLVKKDLFPTIHQANAWLQQHPEADKNETSAIAKKIVDEDKLVSSAMNDNGGDIKKAAIQYHISKGDELGNQLAIMQRDGAEIPKELEGELVHDLLNTRSIKEGIDENQNLRNIVKTQELSFYRDYPELRNKMLLTKIAKGREDFGYNNWFLNLPGKKSSDEIVNSLMANGEINAEDKEFYDQYTRKIIGAGIADIPTPGLIERTVKGTANAIGTLPKAAYEATGLRDLLHSRGDILSANLQEDLDKTPEPQYKGLMKKFSSATGDLLGIVTPIGLESKALTSFNVIKNAATASEVATGLTFYHDIQKEESKRNPDNPYLAHLSALLQSAVWMKGTQVFGNLSKDLIKTSSPEINTILKSLQEGEINNATAAKSITSVITDKALSVTGNSIKESGKVAGLTMLNKTISDVLNGEMHLNETVNAGVDTFENMMFGLPMLEIAKVAGSKNMTSEYLNEIASHPEEYRNKITDPKQKENFEYLLEVKNELDGREDLTPKQKKEYQLVSLKQKILEGKISDSPDKLLATKDQKAVDELEIEKKIVLDPELSNTKIVQEFFDNELLGKSSLENLSVRDADGKPTNKFDPSKTGEYLKEAAQRLNNLDSDWKPNKAGDSAEAAKSSYPEAIQEIANKRWEKEIEASRPKLEDQDRTLEMEEEPIVEEKITQTPPKEESVSVPEGDLVVNKNNVNLQDNGKETQNISGEEVKSTSNTSGTPIEESPEALGKRYKRITDENDFVDPYDVAVKYFADGGRINPSELERIFGGKGDKGARISLMKNDAGTVKQIAHFLWESSTDKRFEDTDYIDAVESALRDFSSKSAMQKDIADRYDLEAGYKKHLEQKGVQEDIDIVERMTEEEINHILELESNKEKQSELENYIDGLATKKNPKVADLEAKRDAEIKDATKPTIDFDKAEKELNDLDAIIDRASSTVMTKEGRANDRLKKNMEALKQLINCIYG